MKIGILAPLPQELISLTRRKVSIGACLPITENITACLSGMGGDNARKGGQRLLALGAKFLISWGTAASLTDGMEAGELLLPQAVRDSNNKMYQTDDRLRNILCEKLPADMIIHHHTLGECSRILKSVPDKKAWFEETDCPAADMESASLAQLAEEEELPFNAIRVVLDPLNMVIPETITECLDQSGQFNILKFLLKSAVRPKDWPVIAELANNYKKASGSLKTVAKVLKDSEFKV